MDFTIREVDDTKGFVKVACDNLPEGDEIPPDLLFAYFQNMMHTGGDYARYCGNGFKYIQTMSSRKNLKKIKKWDIEKVAALADFVTKNSPTLVSINGDYENIDMIDNATAIGNIAYITLHSENEDCRARALDAFNRWCA